ncbi:MAG: RNA methyltransferase [Acidimicrobiales bacterium]
MSAGALSSKNPRVKQLRRLVSQRKARSQERAFVAEGPVLVTEALNSSLEVTCVYVEATDDLSENAVVELAYQLGVEVNYVVHGALSAALSTVSPQPVAAVVMTPEWVWPELVTSSSVLVLDDVRDPGNVGTLIRTAEAAGCAGCPRRRLRRPDEPEGCPCECRGGVSPPGHHRARPPKSIRSSSRRRSSVFGYVVGGRFGSPTTPSTWQTAALVLGNEAAGLDWRVAELCDATIIIPLAGPTESLNVASAGAILLLREPAPTSHHQPAASEIR